MEGLDGYHPALQRGRDRRGPSMSSAAVARPEPTPFWSALFTDRRIAPALGLGFTSGIPFLLVYSTQSAWLSDAGISLATIGLLSELTLAYKFKFLWAPFLDQYDPPLLGRILGRRRAWIIVAQLGVMATLAASRSAIRRIGSPGRSCSRSPWASPAPPSTSSLTAGASPASGPRRSRRSSRPGRRSGGASATSRPAPAPVPGRPDRLARRLPLHGGARGKIAPWSAGSSVRGWARSDRVSLLGLSRRRISRPVLNVRCVFSDTATSAPLRGLRAVYGSRFLTANTPKSRSSTRSPCARAAVMVSRIVLTIFSASRWNRCEFLSAILSINSDLSRAGSGR